jgi:hypothetical protein
MSDLPILIPFRSAHEEFMRALGEGWGADGLNQRMQDAYGRYLHALQMAQASEQAHTAEAYRQFADVFQTALTSTELPKRLGAAYRTFVPAVQRAWAEADPQALTPEALMAIGQSMMVVAWTAGMGTAPAGSFGMPSRSGNDLDDAMRQSRSSPGAIVPRSPTEGKIDGGESE